MRALCRTLGSEGSVFKLGSLGPVVSDSSGVGPGPGDSDVVYQGEHSRGLTRRRPGGSKFEPGTYTSESEASEALDRRSLLRGRATGKT